MKKLLCTALALLCEGIICTVRAHAKGNLQLLQLFMGNMEKLLSPHWEGYKIYWRERFEKLSTEDKAEYPLLLENVPDDLFQLPDDYEEKCFEVSFYTW